MTSFGEEVELYFTSVSLGKKDGWAGKYWTMDVLYLVIVCELNF